jgi:hypothetical protein
VGTVGVRQAKSIEPRPKQRNKDVLYMLRATGKEGQRRKMAKKPKRDACYKKVKARYTRNGGTWPSAYASGALVQCRKVGAKNWGNKSKKK